MAAIFQIRRGTSNISITDGELYLHKGSGSIQFGSGSNNPITLLPLNAPVNGNIILTGNITASNAYFSGDVAISGNLFLGNTSGDNISVPGVFTTNLVPGTNGTLDLGTNGAKWRTLWANSVSASFSGSVNGINITSFSQSVDSQFDALSTISASLISTASANTISVTNLNSFSGSQLEKDTALATITGSLILTASNQEQRLDAMEAESGSYARTNSANSFVGNQTITGSLVTSGSKVEFNVQWPSSPGEQHIVKTNPFTVDNRNYEYAGFALEHFEDSPGTYHNAWNIYMYDPTNTYGSEMVVGPYRNHFRIYPSGSGGHSANISVQDLNDGRTQALVYGDFVQIGNVHAESIIIGNSGSVIEISGSIKTAQLNAIGTITGSLILTASNHEQRIGQLENVSGSLLLTASNHSQRITNVESFSSSFDTAFNLSGADVTIAGNLTVNGTTTAVNSTTIQLGDNIIELNGTGVQNAGLLVKDPTSPNTISGSLLWDSTLDYWKGGAVGNESKILLAGGDGVISSSMQLTQLNSFSASTNDRLSVLEVETTNLETFSSSTLTRLTALEVETSNLETFSGSQLTQNTALGIVTASYDGRFTTLGTYTASVETRFSTLATLTGSNLTRLTSLEVETSNLETFSSSALTRLSALEVETSNLETFSGSQLEKDITLATYTSSIETRLTQIGVVSGSLITSASNHRQRIEQLENKSQSVDVSISNLNSYTQSVNTQLVSIYQTTASLNSYTSSVSQSVRNLNIFSSSYYLDSASFDYRIRILDPGNIDASLTLINRTTASLNLYTQSLNNAIQLTGSTVSFLGNIVVYGTQSIINSENLAVTDNLIYLNNGSTVTNPDLGIVGNYNDGTYAHSGIFRDASDNGAWKVFKGYTLEPSGTIDASHNSFELADFKAATITGTTIVGSIAATNGVVSGSSQLIGILSSLNSYTQSNDTTNTTQNSRLDQLSTASGSAITRLTALEVETSNLETFTSSINTTIKNQLNANTVVSGSSQISGLQNSQLTNSSITIAGTSVSLGSSITLATITGGSGIISGSTQLGGIYETTGRGIVSGSSQIVPLLPAGVVSGSSQVDLTTTTNYASGILARLNAVGVVSGSSQINLGSANGNITLATQTTGNYVASLVEGTGVTITNNSGENATPTIAIGQAVGTSNNVRFASIGVNVNPTGVAGEIVATGDITAFFSSDIRLKENIQPIENALEKVNQISGNTYDWKEGYDEVHSHKGNDVGVIAQEIEQILPQIVTNRDNGFKAVQYEKIIPLLIEAIKELSAKVDRLENK